MFKWEKVTFKNFRGNINYLSKQPSDCLLFLPGQHSPTWFYHGLVWRPVLQEAVPVPHWPRSVEPQARHNLPPTRLLGWCNVILRPTSLQCLGYIQPCKLNHVSSKMVQFNEVATIFVHNICYKALAEILNKDPNICKNTACESKTIKWLNYHYCRNS